MKITIRKARMEDAEELQQLNKNDLGYEYPLHCVREQLKKIIPRDSDRIFVACFEDHIVGYVHANDYDVMYAGAIKNIMGIAVAKKFQRQGIATMLLDEVALWAKVSGAQGIRLVSGKHRSGAHAFYRTYGFTEEKEQLNFKKIYI